MCTRAGIVACAPRDELGGWVCAALWRAVPYSVVPLSPRVLGGWYIRTSICLCRRLALAACAPAAWFVRLRGTSVSCWRAGCVVAVCSGGRRARRALAP